ncbi:hypothetical protein HMPREF1544_00705 [Mucor circinelloides 1006PhL]|uniref:Uncharacterized protein n=1 Tax=Mucor circinelloides f. circinelloides (strain 1006PhL) TaxID=1220926 RepID=S2JVH7_MUCC1|nr:hypothetical protein HMPREF1544_00705 [Mucor circinelloides 1006PhL]
MKKMPSICFSSVLTRYQHGRLSSLNFYGPQCLWMTLFKLALHSALPLSNMFPNLRPPLI